MPCKCIEVVNDKLKERNTRLALPLIFSFKGEPAKDQRVMIETEQLEKGRGKQKAVGMFPTYCPFCGVQHDVEPALSTEAALLSIARDYCGSIEYNIRRDLKDGDEEGATLKRFTLAYVKDVIAKAEGRS